MKKLRAKLLITLLIGVLTVLLAVLWMWWTRPEVVDMAQYAPAEALVYIESNDIASLAAELAATDTWQQIANRTNSNLTARRINWLTRLSGFTGIGTAETVVFSRAQAAVVVTGIDSAAENETLKIKPRFALIVETHSSNARAYAALERLAARFAVDSYQTPQIARREANETKWTTWTAPETTDEAAGGKRQIVLAVRDSIGIIGNDTAAVEATLAVLRSERASLADNADLKAMRERAGASEALAFGYVSAANANKLFAIFAPLYAAQLTIDSKIQSAAATLLPQFANRFLNGAAWTMRRREGQIEDAYVFNLPADLTERLTTSLTVADAREAQGATALLPATTAQATCYFVREPTVAWRNLNGIVSSQLDTALAPFAVTLLEKSLAPYGINHPRDFLQSVGSTIWTARLDAEGERTIFIARVRERQQLERELRSSLAAPVRTEQLSNATLLLAARTTTTITTSSDPTLMRRAASFIGDYLVMGGEADVRACIAANRAGTTLATESQIVKHFNDASKINDKGAQASIVTTFSDEREASRQTLRTLINLEKSTADKTSTRSLIDSALANHSLATTETRITRDAIERRTLSNFGQAGRLLNASTE